MIAASQRKQILDEMVSRISQAVHPLQIILFGSWARGEAGENSDIDLLIIMPEGTHRRQTWRKAYTSLRGLGVTKDVIVVTQADVVQHRDNPSLIIKPSLDEGQVLYAA